MKRNLVLVLLMLPFISMTYASSDKDCSKAVQLYTKAVKVKDLDQKEILYKKLLSKLHEELGANYEKQEKLDNAIKEYKTAIEYNPDTAVLYIRIGDIFLKKTEMESRNEYYQEAMKYYEKSLEIKDDALIKVRIEELKARLLSKQTSLPFQETEDIIYALSPKRYIGVIPSIDLYILFAFDSDKILPEAEKQLKALADALVSEELIDFQFELAGHTDSIGSEEYNQGLSERRARSVKRYLVGSFRISSERLVTKGYGENRPIAANTTPEGRQKNRRVQITTIGRIQ